MTYDELVEEVAMICQSSPIDESWEQVAVKIIDTIREAMNNDTEEMINAAEMYSYQGYPGTKGYGGLWRAMLAASPLGGKKG